MDFKTFRKEIGVEDGRRMTKRDYIVLLILLAVYSIVAFVNLGALRSPNTVWTAEPGKTVIVDLGDTRDVTELTEHLKITEEIIPVGHSLGGYTALNAVRLLPNAHKAVVISGFIGVSDLMMGFVKLRLLANSVKRYEKKLMSQYGGADNLAYLASAKDKILWIHSSDDPVVNYKHNGGKVKKLNNPNVRVITAENKKHNPQYAREALGDRVNYLKLGMAYPMPEKKIRRILRTCTYPGLIVKYKRVVRYNAQTVLV